MTTITKRIFTRGAIKKTNLNKNLKTMLLKIKFIKILKLNIIILILLIQIKDITNKTKTPIKDNLVHDIYNISNNLNRYINRTNVQNIC